MGYEIDAINAINDERKSAEARARDHKIIKQHGGDRVSSSHQDDVGTLMARGSNNADYLTSRIARDRPDILDRMKAGEFVSGRAAAKEAGIVAPEVRFQRPTRSDRRTTNIIRKTSGD